MRPRKRAAKLAAPDPSALAIHCPGPVPAKLIAPAPLRRGPSGSVMPNAVSTAAASALRLSRRALTLAKVMSVRSSMVRPLPAAPWWPAVVRPASAERSNPAKLTIEARSFGIEEVRAAELDLDVAAAHRIVGAHALSNPLGP